MKKKLLAFASSIVFLAVLALPVSAQEEQPCTPVAHGQNAAGCTITFKNLTETFTDVVPCPDRPAVITITNANAIFHVTTLVNGTYWATFTEEGQFTAVPVVGSVTYSGHFAIWDGENWNLQNQTFTATFNVTGTGSDGSKLSAHAMAHVNFDATGQPHLTFHMNC